jgi:hypothetical protein
MVSWRVAVAMQLSAMATFTSATEETARVSYRWEEAALGEAT